jgi:hypothetical protein
MADGASQEAIGYASRRHLKHTSNGRRLHVNRGQSESNWTVEDVFDFETKATQLLLPDHSTTTTPLRASFWSTLPFTGAACPTCAISHTTRSVEGQTAIGFVFRL